MLFICVHIRFQYRSVVLSLTKMVVKITEVPYQKVGVSSASTCSIAGQRLMMCLY